MKPAQLLRDWVKEKHQGQFIRRTGVPYFNHVVFVAETAGEVTPFGYEVGLCHDLLEETGTSIIDLQTALRNFGYNDTDTDHIKFYVAELTDVFTKKAYPDLSKAARKEKEAARLATISPVAQTVKYADLIDNVSWVLKYNPTEASSYLQKKQLLLSRMNKGHQPLHRKLTEFIDQALCGLT